MAYVASGATPTIVEFSAATGEREPLLTGGGDGDAWRLAGVSPDGETVAAWLDEDYAGFLGAHHTRSHLYVVDVATRQARLLANARGETFGGASAFSPDGLRLAFYYDPKRHDPPSGGIYVVPWR